MKINLRLAEFYLLLLASLTLGLFVLLFAPREGGVSETENRRLQPFPAMTAEGVFSGEYMEQFESFLSDAFPARESMIRLSGAIMNLFGKADANAEARRTFDEELGMIGDEAPAAVQSAPEAVAQPQAEDAPTPESVSPAIFWVRHRNGAGEIIESYDAATVAHLAGVLNRYRDALGEDGRVFFINSPASDVANELYDTHQYIDWGCDLDEAIAPWLDEGVHLYSVPKLLQPWQDAGEPMFSRSDLHWYVKTAWRVSNAFVRDLGYAPSSFYDYSYYLRDSIRSGPYSPEQLQSMTLERDNLMVPMVLSPVRASLITRLTEAEPTELYDFDHHGYTMYLGGAKGPYRLFETGFHTGRSALLISDSYGFALAYYLFPFYDTVLQTDLRNNNYQLDLVGESIRTYMQQYGVDDVYIITCQWTSINGPVFSWRLEHFLDSADVGQ